MRFFRFQFFPRNPPDSLKTESTIMITALEIKAISNRKAVRRMAKNTKQTSRPVASKASRILKDGRYGKDSKSVAGSALAQTKPSGKRKKCRRG